jgi:hypothetical protein
LVEIFVSNTKNKLPRHLLEVIDRRPLSFSETNFSDNFARVGIYNPYRNLFLSVIYVGRAYSSRRLHIFGAD